MTPWFNTTDQSYVAIRDIGKFVKRNSWNAPTYAPLDLSEYSWDIFFIVSIICLFFVSCGIWYWQMKMISQKKKEGYNAVDTDDQNIFETEYNEKITQTEEIYEILSTYSIPGNITKIIIEDYCGFIHVEHIENSIFEKKAKLFFYDLVVYILIVSLLFAGYCGIIWFIQIDENIDKYSLKLQCECTNIVYKSFTSGSGSSRSRKTYHESYLCKIQDMDDFYNKTWIPFIEKYEPILMEHKMTDLYLLSNENEYFCFDDSESTKNDIRFYLGETGIDDCDWVEESVASDCCDRCCTIFGVVCAFSAIIAIIVLWPLLSCCIVEE